MTGEQMEYTLMVIVDRRSVTLIQRGLSAEERSLELQMDGKHVGEIRLLPFDLPSVAFGTSAVAIWGGRRLYLADPEGENLRCVDREEPIHEVYPIEHGWFLVGETSVALLDGSEASEQARYEHGEVLLNVWWEDNRVIVMDFNGRRLAFDPRVADHALRPLPDW